jgi:hypothetical protein
VLLVIDELDIVTAIRYSHASSKPVMRISNDNCKRFGEIIKLSAKMMSE